MTSQLNWIIVQHRQEALASSAEDARLVKEAGLHVSLASPRRCIRLLLARPWPLRRGVDAAPHKRTFKPRETV